MKNILLFHIGLPKTGTTSLQHFLYDNAECLKKYGWSYPDFSEVIGKTSWENGLYLLNPLYVTYRGRIWDAIAEELKESNVLISEEGFWNENTSWLLSEAKKRHGNIKVILYLRRQDLYFESFYNYDVKTKHVHGTFKEYKESILKNAENFLERLEKIGNLIGDENIIVRVYEKQQFIGFRKDIFSDFIVSVLDGTEPDWNEFQIPERENTALTGAFYEIKKLMNSVESDQRKWWEAEYFNQIANLCKNYPYADIKREGRLTKEERLEILNAQQENNAQIAKKYLHREDGCLFYDSCVDIPVYEEKATPFEADMIRVFSALFHKLQSKIELLPLVTAIKMLRGEKQLAFYGVGERGRKLLDYPLYANILIDNNLNMKNKTEKTIPIVGAEEIKDWTDYFVVVTPNQCEEIEKELLSTGLIKNKDYLLMRDYV